MAPRRAKRPRDSQGRFIPSTRPTHPPNPQPTSTVSTAAPQSPTISKAQEVFDIPELLEKILIHLDDDYPRQGATGTMDIIRCQQVSRTFRATIDGSNKLQYLAFFPSKTANPPIQRVLRTGKSQVKPVYPAGFNKALCMLPKQSRLLTSSTGNRWLLEDIYKRATTSDDKPLQINIKLDRTADHADKIVVSRDASCLRMRLADSNTKVTVRAEYVALMRADAPDWKYVRTLEGSVKDNASLDDIVEWVEESLMNRRAESDAVQLTQEHMFAIGEAPEGQMIYDKMAQTLSRKRTGWY